MPCVCVPNPHKEFTKYILWIHLKKGGNQGRGGEGRDLGEEGAWKMELRGIVYV